MSVFKTQLMGDGKISHKLMEMKSNSIIITTMCAIVNDSGQWLFIDRVKDWKGLALPGGHLDGSESIVQCVRREILEETGLVVDVLQYKGIAHFYNPNTLQRYLVFNFLCKSFKGTVKAACDEGKLKWISMCDFHQHDFAEGMKQRIALFLSDHASEMFVEWNELDGYVRMTKNDLIER